MGKPVFCSVIYDVQNGTLNLTRLCILAAVIPKAFASSKQLYQMVHHSLPT